MPFLNIKLALGELIKYGYFKDEYEVIGYEILSIKQKIKINFGLIKAKKKCEVFKIKAIKDRD